MTDERQFESLYSDEEWATWMPEKVPKKSEASDDEDYIDPVTVMGDDEESFDENGEENYDDDESPIVGEEVIDTVYGKDLPDVEESEEEDTEESEEVEGDGTEEDDTEEDEEDDDEEFSSGPTESQGLRDIGNPVIRISQDPPKRSIFDRIKGFFGRLAVGKTKGKSSTPTEKRDPLDDPDSWQSKRERNRLRHNGWVDLWTLSRTSDGEYILEKTLVKRADLPRKAVRVEGERNTYCVDKIKDSLWYLETHENTTMDYWEQQFTASD